MFGGGEEVLISGVNSDIGCGGSDGGGGGKGIGREWMI